MQQMTRRTSHPYALASAADISPVNCSTPCGGANPSTYYEPQPAKKVALVNYPKGGSNKLAGAAGSYFWQGMLWLAMLIPLNLGAGGWPWSKGPPDQVTASCVIEPAEVEQRATNRLKAKVIAEDTKKHKLAYVWSANGGQIFGNGPEVELDVSGLNPGVYGVAAAAQDAYKNRAECVAQFQVIAAVDPLTARCTVDPPEAVAGIPVRAVVEVADRFGHALRFRWFTNGGVLLPDGAAAQIKTDDMAPGVYSITGRVDDEWGHATDCSATLEIVLPPPPPIPPEPVNLAQIVFPRNVAQLGAAERQQLQKVLDRLGNEPSGRVSLESYAGPDEINPQNLAAGRAEAVRRLLVEQGVEEDRVKVMVGLGGRLGGLRNRTLDVIWIPEGLEY